MNKNLVKHIMDWCIGYYSFSKHHKTTPKLRVYQKMTKRKWMGSYKAHLNQITIYLDGHSNELELIGTVIHEYIHYLQPLAQTYDLLDDHFGYKNNPLEIEAKTIALMDRHKCLNWLKTNKFI